MAFRFQKANCVVVGTFNMYILHPQWLADHGIIEKGTEVAIETNLVRPGFRFRFPKDEPVWSVAPDRIVVESRQPEIDCGRPVARVLKDLPETPLFAIGNNATYEAGLDELEALATRIRDFPKPEGPSEEQTIAQQTIHFAVKRNDQDVINLQLAIKEDAIELSCNAHRQLGDRSEANREAIVAAERFFEDRRESEDLAHHFFGVTISHDTDDA